MKTKSWKYPVLLLSSIGVSNVGDWIYLIALNLIVLDMTGSPLYVALLYILKPLATLITNGWSGSIIDRLNKRNLMVWLDVVRGIIVLCLPLMPSLWMMYSFVLLVNMASSIFHPTAMTYVTKLIPIGKRRRFNALRSLIESGGFLIGPAIAGFLFIIGSPEFAIIFNGVSFIFSGFLTLLLPNLEKSNVTQQKMSFSLVKNDWKLVKRFSMQNVYVMSIYFLFSGMLVMTAAVDSLEAPFAKEVLSLSNSEYGFLVSIAGFGIIIGAMLTTILSNKLSLQVLMGLGSLIVSVGYLLYAFSNTFLLAAVGFFVLSFSLAFATTGFHTFYQNRIPVDMMGRVGSMYDLVESALVILITILFGITAHVFEIQSIVIVGAIFMSIVTVILNIFLLSPSLTIITEEKQ
ncbi:MFS transporter [Aquibacillus kalidii]|uniref:MFS transporter n=1 Tax=Aquibacillus kalidii TaxID=2762597 RepID=UPI001649265E|nr:MFS transporter [Aquibacillus kalidii]